MMEKRSIVIASVGQRMAHRPQRMQRVSSLSMAAPVTTGNMSDPAITRALPARLSSAMIGIVALLIDW